MILIDRRTGSKEFERYFDNAEITDLEFGDFAFFGNGPDHEVFVGIERKAIRDLLNSLKSGRLWGHQIPGMLEMYDFSYLIVEGPFRPQPDYLMVPQGRRWRRVPMGTKHIDPFLNTIQVLTGVMLRETSGKKQTATLVQHLHEWWQRPFEEHGMGVYHRIPRLPKDFCGDLVLLRTCQALPNIGLKRGEDIENHFESVVEMVNADEADWLEIPGIGQKMAENIREALGH